MDIGIGLPTTVPDTNGADVVEWARRAEACGFSTLAVLDRLAYDNYEPVVSLAAAAAVTERIRLATTILIAPYRPSSALLAKQLATVDHLSGGRLVVGVAAGGRDDDFIAAGTTYDDRGMRLDVMLTELRDIWAGRGTDGIGPRPVGDMPIVVGGHSPAAMRRAAKFGTAWIAGGSSASSYGQLVGQSQRQWTEAGRVDEPRKLALAYVSVGDDGYDRAYVYLTAYYAFIGAKAEMAVKSVHTDADRLRSTLAEYAEAGCDELVLLPCTADPAQLDAIAEAVLS